MLNKLFSGIMPALVSPFDAEGNFKRAACEKLIDHELAMGVDGFYINGATGEGVFLSEKCRMDLAETAMDKCKGKGKIINHIGAVDTMSAIRLAKHAGQIGCDAVSSLVPNYVYTYSEEEILDYYKRIADASGLPVLVYCTGLVKGNPYAFMKQAMKIDGVIGCKYTMFDYYSMQRITELNGGDINVINGPDEMLLLGLTMGADGGIGSTYNIMGKWYVELYKAFRAGEYEKARALQIKINKGITVILENGDCRQSIKVMLNAQGLDVGYMAYPAKMYSEEKTAKMIADMKAVGVEF